MMKRRLVTLGGIAITILAAAGSGFRAGSNTLAGQDRVVPIPVQVEPRRPKIQNMENLMEAKLENSEKILRGLVTHDFDQVRKAAEELKMMSLKPPKDWKSKDNDNEVYEHFRMEFMRLASRLEQEAEHQRLAGAAWFQQQLTATCIACHDYIRDDSAGEP